MVEHRERTSEEKAAVLAALLTGQSVSDVARQFRVSRETVRRWRTAAGMTDMPVIDHQKRAEIDGLVGDFLRGMLASLRVQTELFADKTWLREQNAADLAVLFGVQSDKLFRVLEAAQAADEQAPPDVP